MIQNGATFLCFSLRPTATEVNVRVSGNETAMARLSSPMHDTSGKKNMPVVARLGILQF